MIVDERPIGVIHFGGSAVADPDLETIADPEAMALQAASAIEAMHRYEQTIELAMTKELTSAPNRRSFDRDLSVACVASAHDDTPLALLILDVDHFKAHNEIYGNRLADIALTELAQVLRAGLREADSMYRCGDDEFALILRDTDEGSAKGVAESALVAVRTHFSPVNTASRSRFQYESRPAHAGQVPRR